MPRLRTHGRPHGWEAPKLRPRLLDRCAELAAVGVPGSVDHADLHGGQLFRTAAAA
ncbi:hypothetical protein [Streptomyces sp. NPDC017260]|uniref:hypothetical protein n=1 Tax=unclassified Streptomyces TaxID=2593676 RepID=UPI0037BAD7E6